MKANKIIETASKMRAQGADEDQLLDYVKNQTAHYGTVFKNNKGLSRIRVSSKDREIDSEGERQAQHQQHSDGTELIFLNNR